MIRDLFAILEHDHTVSTDRPLSTPVMVDEAMGELAVEVRTHLLESAWLKEEMAEHDVIPIVAASQRMAKALRSGKKILLCGNGGSAADCQHMATEFVSRLHRNFSRPGIPAIALTTDTSFLTAFSNDCGFEGAFERQVQTLGQPGDVLIGISTSGNSPNVIRAMEAAAALGMTTIALTGSGGRLAQIAEMAISVPRKNTLHIQEAHLAIEHILCSLVERLLFGSEQGQTPPDGVSE
jgi:D-sedoheptulose 7-phosphate isomerase